MPQDDALSLGGEATFSGQGQPRPPRADVSIGDERTLGGGDAAGIDTVIDDIEIVDLEARYRVEGELGQGGMGAVLLATDRRLDRRVAIKRILGEAARSRTAVMRFLTEAKAIAALNHPNVIDIYDYGRAKDGPFLIMEFVDGGSLLDLCRAGAVPLDRAVDLVSQVCDGLGAAHEQGIVHRDIKPANVLVSRGGLPKLTDFGLAKAEAADHGMTMAGAVMGTPDFMPPEQRRDAAEVDHRSDLWSLAATLYQMVTGRSPKIIRFDLLPAELTKVLGKALEEEKDARYQSAREFRDALRAAVRTSTAVAGDVAPGQCVACGVINDLTRKFCGGCGASLRAPCLSCRASIGTWERICGECGGRQSELAEARSADLARRRDEADGLLEECRFDAAQELLAAFPIDDLRFREFTDWKQTFVSRLENARTSEVARTAALVAEALQHERAYDYQAAARALEKVVPPMRDVRCGEAEEAAAAVLARVTGKRDEVQQLDKFIRQAIRAKETDSLLPHVNRLFELKPNRADVATVKRQLEKRKAKSFAGTGNAESNSQHEEFERLAGEARRSGKYGGVRRALEEYVVSAPAGPSADKAVHLLNMCNKEAQGLHNRLVARLIVLPFVCAFAVGSAGSQKWMPPGVTLLLLLGFFVLTAGVLVTSIKRLRQLHR